MISFQAGQLPSSIIRLEQDQFTGTVSLTTQKDAGEAISKVLFFWKGTLTFVGDHLPTPLEFAEFLKEKFKLIFMDSALKILDERVKNKNSIRELLEFFNRFGLVKWETVESAMKQELVVTLEHLLPHSGILQPIQYAEFDLSYGYDGHGFSWESLKTILAQRHQKWQALQPLSPNSIPVRTSTNVSLEEEIKTHLETWVDGQRSLLEIATSTNTDPLQLAALYAPWMKQGWITLPSETHASKTQQGTASHRPVILSVDDSPIVQVSIQRAISDRYEVLCAKNAVEALGLLNTRKVELLLLDVTMPDIDGLEFCRTIRSIGKFKDLPVIMLTAKDGFMDKVKGQFAGSTHYLTKPVDREKLLPVMEKYISVKEAIA